METREVAQQLSVCIVIAEDLRSLPSTHDEQLTTACYDRSKQEMPLTSRHLHLCAQTHTQAHMHTQNYLGMWYMPEIPVLGI